MKTASNFPPNGYYNPQPPRRKEPTQLEISSANMVNAAGANDKATWYASLVGSSDQPQLGGNGDGRLGRREIELRKSISYNEIILAQNDYQQTGDFGFKILGDAYYQRWRTLTNLEQNFSIFAQADPSGNGQITPQGILNVAARDGDPTRLTAQDVNPTMMPYGGMQPQYSQMPMPYGGGGMMGGYPPAPMPYGGGQPLYNSPPPMMMPYGYPMQPYQQVSPDFTLQQISQNRSSLADTTQEMLGLLQELDPKSPNAIAIKQRLFALQDIDQKLEGQSQRVARQAGYNPTQLRDPNQIFVTDFILPSIELDVLKPQADNPDKWDAKQLAKDVQTRISQLDSNGDGQLSFQEGRGAKGGLLGNGVLKIGNEAVWATLAGPDGKISARELAAALVTVDYDSNGTVSTAENANFINSTSSNSFLAPSTVKGMYNDIDLKAQRIGLDAYLPQTGEVGYTKQLEEQLKGATKEEIKSELAFSAEKLKTLQVEYDSMDLKTPEAQRLGLLIATVTDGRADLRRFQGNNWLSEQFPLDSLNGIAPSAEKYAKEFDAKYDELTKKISHARSCFSRREAIKKCVSRYEKFL
jgi:hypothetical protein